MKLYVVSFTAEVQRRLFYAQIIGKIVREKRDSKKTTKVNDSSL